ncbi:MAG TPA: ParA family partition ATPase [Pirellulales bacterium]|nr:ParA family partition ATPase [Pirellulales bacterium]
MPKVIAILNQKGGVGKTTLAIHIATAIARRDRKVLLIDADPQNSALDWAAAREGHPLFPVVGLPKSSIHKELPTLTEKFDVVVIDGPPRVHEVARSAIMASDLVLVPVQPSPYDVWASKEIMDLLNEATVYKPSLKKAFVINRKIVNTAIGRDVAQALSEYPVPVLNTAISQRVAFAESATRGLTVFELDPDMLAAQEMSQLADEAETLLGINVRAKEPA